MKKVLVLSSAESDYTIGANQTFVRDIEARLSDVAEETCHYRDVALYIAPGRIEASRLSNGVAYRTQDLCNISLGVRICMPKCTLSVL